MQADTNYYKTPVAWDNRAADHGKKPQYHTNPVEGRHRIDTTTRAMANATALLNTPQSSSSSPYYKHLCE